MEQMPRIEVNDSRDDVDTFAKREDRKLVSRDAKGGQGKTHRKYQRYQRKSDRRYFRGRH